MKLEKTQTIATEVLVIGGGGAGLRAAIEARKNGSEVLLLSLSRAGYGNNTAISMGMFAASSGTRDPRDNPGVHLQDTVVSGRYMNNQVLAEVMAEGAWQQVKDLEEMGVEFKKSGSQTWIMHVPGHTYPRHVSANRTLGAEFTLPMRRYAEEAGVRFLEGVQVTKLLVSHGGVSGVTGIDTLGNLYVIYAGATVLASGGAGEVFLRTNNAAGSTGDGIALCYGSGLPLVDMEFVQFYPTTLGEYGSRVWAYEVTLGRGATLRNSLGEDILEKHNLKNFMTMTRDRLARAIMLEILDGHDIDGKMAADFSIMPDDLLEKMHRINKNLRYPEKAMVAPAAHYFMGGVDININTETALNNLFVAGELCGGIHGANRLTGNAITDIFVFGAIAGRQAARLKGGKSGEAEVSVDEEAGRLQGILDRKGRENLEVCSRGLRETMWKKAGIIRSRESLGEALREVTAGQNRIKQVPADNPRDLIKLLKLENMLLVSEMVCKAAIMRTESRGSHYRTDFPGEDNGEWLKNIFITSKNNEMELAARPVAFTKISPQ